MPVPEISFQQCGLTVPTHWLTGHAGVIQPPQGALGWGGRQREHLPSSPALLPSIFVATCSAPKFSIKKIQVPNGFCSSVVSAQEKVKMRSLWKAI